MDVNFQGDWGEAWAGGGLKSWSVRLQLSRLLSEFRSFGVCDWGEKGVAQWLDWG